MNNLCQIIARNRFSILTLAILFFFLQTITAQKSREVVITGEAQFAIGKEIRLIVFDDLLTYQPKTVASTKIAKDGSFRLTYKTNQIKLVQLAIQTSKAEFLVIPGKHYNFFIDMDLELFQLLSPLSYGGFLQIVPVEIDTTELNYRIRKFEIFFDKLNEQFYPDIIYHKNLKLRDSILNVLNEKFQIHYDPLDFHASYLYYSFGILDLIIYQKSVDTIYKNYLDNEYVLYDNPAYMTFFNSFYDNYLYNSPRISKEVLTQFINRTPDYLAIFNELGKDPVLRNERIRELVIIKNLREFYEDAQFNGYNILYLLEFILKNTHFPEHKPIIKNIIASTQRLHSNSEFPKCSLKEASGVDFKLEKLKGKWVYLQFFSSQCEDCIREMLIIKELEKKYKDSLVFVSVSLDFNFNDFVDFKQDYKLFDWKFVHFNFQFDWLDELEINTLPDNILLNPKGRIALRDVPVADKGLATFLSRKFAVPDKEENPLSPHFRK